MAAPKDPMDLLFEDAMKGRWSEVIGAYRNNPSLHRQRITRSGFTALHIAVSDNQSDVVSELVDIIAETENPLEILSIQNETGNTALHLAASIGNVEMCHVMVEKYPELVMKQNNENETPLFSSVIHGQKKAYLCLNSHYREKNHGTDYTLCRRGNGDTILHCAISSNYFGLALKIKQDYPKLVSYMNESGLSPFHVLAYEHNAFRSGSFFGLIDSFIYCCIIVNEKPEEEKDDMDYHNNSKPETKNYPENYADCMILFELMKIVGAHIMVVIDIVLESWRVFRYGRKENRQETVGSSEPSSSCAQQSSDKSKDEENPPESRRAPKSCAGKETVKEDGKKEIYPPNYEMIVLYLKLVLNIILIMLGLGFWKIQKIKEKKQQHVWANLLMNELVESASLYKYDYNGRNPMQKDNDRSQKDGGQTEVPERMPSIDESTTATDGGGSSAPDEAKKNTTFTHEKAKIEVTELANTPEKSLVLLTFEKKDVRELKKRETPILIAAKLGVVEMVDKILDTFPVAIQDVDAEKKNVVLLAVEYRQTEIYNFLRNKTLFKETVFRHLDNQGNSALHLAAKYSDSRPKVISGAALQMQWEMKWYKFVRQSMPRHTFAKHNNEGQTPGEIFMNTHKEVIAKGGEWLTKTSESCSVVAALIATVAFATSATVPGGVKEDTGVPTLENRPAFDVFAIASLVALSFSVTALVFFLSILTSRYQEKDFVIDLPRKLLLGLTSLFISIASMLLSFCAGHFFVLKDKLKDAAFPVYAASCLPVTFFAFAQLPLYFDLTRAIFNKEPQRGYKH